MLQRLQPLRLQPHPTRSNVQRAAARHGVRSMAIFGSPLVFYGVRALPRRAIASVMCVLAFSTAMAVTTPSTNVAGDLSDFILNFVRYASWPADTSRKNVTICHAHGGAQHAGILATDTPATVKGLPVVWRAVTTVAQVTGCNVLWLNADVRPAPREWLIATHDQSILTISNYADFAADGGVVGAYRVGTDWRFEINLESLQRSKINVAAAALRLSQKPKNLLLSGGETR